jgi:hypothetical protein
VSQQINLYNPAFERKRDLLSFPGTVAAVGAALAFAVVVLVAMSIRTGNLEHKLAQASAARDSAQSETTRLAGQLAARKPNPQLAAEVARLERGLASRKQVMATLRGGVIGDTRGFSAHLAAFARQSFPGIWLTGLKVASAGQDVVLEGRAVRPELVPDYLRRLNREQVMRGHAFAELEMRRSETENGSAQLEAKFIEFRLSTLPASGTATARGAQ